MFSVPWFGRRRLSRPMPYRLAVEALEDRFLPSTYTVTTTKDLLGDSTPGEVTLRDALTAINTLAPSGNAVAGTTSNTIRFAVGPAGSVQTIRVGSGNVAAALPALIRRVFIDGWSQGGATYGGPPLIVLNGASAGAGANGLELDAGATGSTVRGLVIQLFSANGIESKGATSILIAGNYIGTDSTGTSPMGNGNDGILLDAGARGNIIGGSIAGAGNVISGNGNASAHTGNGIEITGATTNANSILGNKIGTDKTGTVALGNGGADIRVAGGSTSNTIGGTDAGAANIICGSATTGVAISGAGTRGNTVLGNLIGTNAQGTATLGALGKGILIDAGASGNTVGGTTTAAANIVAGSGDGIGLSGAGTAGNTIAGNRIGTNAGGTLNLGNTFAGVLLENGASSNTVGGTIPGSGNTIAFNSKGVVVGNSPSDITTVGDSILGNSIYHNTSAAISLGNQGATPNGANPRPFPNNGQNTPLVTAVALTGVSGSLSSVPRATFRIEVFATPIAGTAPTLLGSLNVITNAAGTVTFTVPVTTIPLGAVVTATATNLTTGDTSELSPAGTQLLVSSAPTVASSTAAQTITLSAQVLSGTVPVVGGQVRFIIAGIPGQVIGTTNAFGIVTVSFVIPAGTKPGQYAIVATLLGEENETLAMGVGALTITTPTAVTPVARRWAR